MADRGQGWDVLRRTLRGYARHPNIGALVVLGLVCEVNAVSALMQDLNLAEDVPVAAYSIQDAGGTRAAIDHGVSLVRGMAGDLRGTAREDVGVEHLVVGLQCGGSDGFSGLTANPALGIASDMLVRGGATSILGETPEIYGAEQMLAARATDPKTAEALLRRIAWWEEYAQPWHDPRRQPVAGQQGRWHHDDPREVPGRRGQGRHSPLAGVCEYAEPVPCPGPVFMDTPGYGPVSVTGMVDGGANLVCFTTGRGSVFGRRPVPTVKLATNADLARRIARDIDLDFSGLLGDEVTLAETGRAVYDLLLHVAGGQRSFSEELGLGGEEMVPWQIGAVL